MQLTRTFLAALVVALVTPLATPTDPAAATLPTSSSSPPPPPPPPPPSAPTPDSAPAPAAGDHRHLSAAWSTLFSGEGSPGLGPGAAGAAGVGPHRRRHHHLRHRDHAAKPCPSCGVQRELLEQDGHDELSALRIEFVKQQILKKLGLKEPPVVPKRSDTMPKPLALAGLALPLPARHREDNADEFYGRTDQVILFPTEQESACAGSPDATCFLFKLPSDIQGVDVTHADLWLYRKGVQADASNATLAVAEVANWDLDASFQRRNPLAAEPVADGEGWVKVDFARPIKYWLEFNELVKMVEASGVPVATDGPYKPFLVIATNPVSKVRRPKRNARCVPGMSECCRDNLYVSFKEIGWDDWILQPLGYEAYFCRGSCTTAASLTITGSHHNAIVRRLMQTGRKVDLVPCCTPTKYSEISLLYINNNQTYIQKTLPNMVVEACGCN